MNNECNRSTERLLPLLLIVLTLAGCDPMPNDTKPANVAALGKHMSYFRDDYGLCYAMVSTASYGAFNVASIASVPCDKVGL